MAISNKKIEEFIKQQRERGKRDSTIKAFLRSKGVDIAETSLEQKARIGNDNAIVPSSQKQQQSPFSNPVLSGLDRFGKAASNFATGAAKGFASTLKGTLGLAEKVGQFGTGVKTQRSATDIIPKEATTPVGTSQKAGFLTEQIAEFAIPGTKVSKATKELSFVSKIVANALSSGAVATAQSGKVGKETAIAAGAEAVIPTAGRFVFKPIVNIMTRFFKGLGSALAGVGSKNIDEILANPSLAKEFSDKLFNEGNASVLRRNAQEIIDGVSSIRKEASDAYRKGLEKLASIDIKPSVFRANTQKFLDKVSSSVKEGVRTIKNVEFDDPKNMKKASELIDKLSRVDLDGVSLRKLIDDIDNAAYKIATSDERLAFNSFIREMSSTLKTAINESTDKLQVINKNYSADIQLAEAIESIFGKVKFKSLSEINKIAQNLEQLFSKKGLSPDILDEFLEKAGIGQSLKTSEAVRQISNVVQKSNTRGLSFTELIQQVTSSVLTPEVIKNVAIATGLTREIIKPILEKLAPSARGVFIRLFIEGTNENTTEDIQ